jgi:basic amino acid/polyamine antiporter, APA family
MRKTAASGKRSIGKITAVFLTAAMIVGTGLFTSLGAATAKAGSGILVAMLIGGLIALLTGISAAEVGINYPEEGGAFIWTRRFRFPTISFIAGFAYIFDGIVGLGILALGFATYSAQAFPGLPVPLVASIALIAVAAVNFLGISPTSKILIGVFFINLMFLGLYVGFALPSVQAKHLTPVLGSGLGGVLSGAAVFFWTWDGFQRTAIMANEIRDPKKAIPFAVVGGIVIAAIIYLIVAATTLGVLGADAMGKTDTPIFLGATTAIASWGIWMVLASAWMTAFSEMLGDLLSTSKVGHAMGKAKELPHWLGVVHKRFQSPHHALLVLTIIGVALVNLFPLRLLMPAASACTLIWYAATNFDALELRKEQRLVWPAVSWLALPRA